jgi:hypothetical protein
MAKRQKDEDAIWERLPGESVKQYEKFCAYRDMRTGDPPARRSIRGLAKKSGYKRQYLEELSSRFDWVARCEAYDLDLARQLREQNEAEIKKMHENHAKLATQLLTKATKRLLSLPEDEITATDMTRMFDIGVKIERLSRGEPTENQAISGEITTKSKGGLDLSRLSDEELRRLAAMGGGEDEPTT